VTRVPETFRTIYADPGEDFGWCVGRDTTLLAAGTTKMWSMADDVWAALNAPDDPSIPINNEAQGRNGVAQADLLGPIGRIVCEDWRLYPWVIAKGGLDFDQCRTARVIGALQFMCRVKGIPFVLQPASIKPEAVAAGAEELYYRPLRENRHANDSIQHFTFFTNVELLKIDLRTKAERG
jgi:hypothetical protein